MQSSNFQVVVVRQSMLAELYGAHLWMVQCGCELLVTAPVTQMTSDLLDKISGKRILIVGGYYSSNMSAILDAAKEVTVFYNSSDVDELVKGYQFITSVEFTGFLTWTVQQLNIQEPYILRMSKYLDEYLYGYPSDEAMCFQNGVYVIDKDNDLDKILTIKSNDDISPVIVKGREKRINNRRVAEQRLKTSKQLTFKAGDEIYTCLCSIGDTPIVDTCLLLAEKSNTGIGVLFRYDINTSKTFISCRTTLDSGIDAGLLMKKWIHGGGSKPMGGGSVSGLHFPDHFSV